MTVQIPDRIVLEETTHPLYCELPAFGPEHTFERLSPLIFPNTALRRGYVATWAIRGGFLYLEKLMAKIWPPRANRSDPEHPSRETHEEVPVGLLETHGTDGPIPSEWISQELSIGYGQFETTPRSFYGAVPSRFRIISVDKGRVITDRVIENMDKS